MGLGKAIGGTLKFVGKAAATVVVGGAGIVSGVIGESVKGTSKETGEAFSGLADGCFKTVSNMWDKNATKEEKTKQLKVY